jgi:hypothetical protein
MNDSALERACPQEPVRLLARRPSGGALKSPGGVDELGEVGVRAPVEVELGARIVEPIGMMSIEPRPCVALR